MRESRSSSSARCARSSTSTLSSSAARRSRTAGRFTCGPATTKAGWPWMRPRSSKQPPPKQEPQNMPATIVDSAIFGNLFSTEARRQVWSDENRTRKYLDIEAALARVQARLGIIPAKAAAEIVRNCRLEKIDLRKLRAQTERIGYPVLGVVQQLVELCADDLGEWCHWGATTQDITDTATVLQIREGLALIEDDLTAISAAMAELARRHRDTPMIGRSNLQQAVPVTFGYKMAGLLSAIERHRARLAELRPRVLMGEFAGAAGTLASLGQGGLETQAGLMKELGLAQPVIAWHTLRDTIAEVGEVYEPFAHGRGSSSTMPQKRNPISSCYIHACAGVVRQQVAALLDAMLADHERSTGPWEIEWIALPEAFLLSAGALSQAKAVVGGLEVDAKRMRANLDSTKGLVVSEAVMMGLAPHLGREAIRQDRPLLDLLSENAAITQHVDRKKLSELCDPSNYLGLSGVMVDRVLERIRAAPLIKGV